MYAHYEYERPFIFTDDNGNEVAIKFNDLPSNFHSSEMVLFFQNRNVCREVAIVMKKRFLEWLYSMHEVNNRLETFLDSYLECIAWADCNDDRDENFTDSLGFSDEMLLQAKNDCKRFLEIVGDKLPDELLSQAAHDLWLTRNGHGTGFWDRSEIYGQENSDYFTSLCHWHDGEFKEKYVYVGNDNLIYFG